MQLRFVLKPEPVPNFHGMVSTVRSYRCLQQWWESDLADRKTGIPVPGEWRDVPLERSDPAGERQP